MDTKFQTSFIPKKNLSGSESYAYRTPLGVFLIVAICVTVFSLILAGGAFAYKTVVAKDLASKQDTLEEKSKELPTADIDKLARLADKLDSAKILLATHLTITPIFDLLQKSTLESLRFDSLTYTYLAANKIAVSMKGTAKDFGVVAKQSDAFAEIAGSKFKNSLFSDLDTNDKGDVTFSFLTSIDPNLVLYKNNL